MTNRNPATRPKRPETGHSRSRERTSAAAIAARKVEFRGNNEFQAVLRRRVDDYFAATSTSRHDSPAMYVKAALILLCLATSYLLLVFVAATWWQALPLAIVLGLSMTSVGFNLMHDGGHGVVPADWPVFLDFLDRHVRP